MKRLLTIVFGLLIIAGCKKDNDEEQVVLPNAEQYVTWQVGTTKGEFIIGVDTISASRIGTLTEIIANSPTTQNFISALFSGNRAPGTYNSNMNMNINGITYQGSNEPVRVTVNQFGDTGDFITGSYSGELRDADFKRYAVKGYFKIRMR